MLLEIRRWLRKAGPWWDKKNVRPAGAGAALLRLLRLPGCTQLAQMLQASSPQDGVVLGGMVACAQAAASRP